MDTRVYEVHFLDGRTKELAMNTIAEALYTQCNTQVKIVNGKKVVKCTTHGWERCCECKDGSTSWQKLSDLIMSLTLFRLLRLHLQRALPMNHPSTGGCHGSSRREAGLSPCAQYHKLTHTFGIEFPQTVDEAYAINKIELEMENVWVAFDNLPDGVVPPSDHQYTKCHMIFDIKMEDFCHKALLVAGGHMTKAPATLTYTSIVS
ncbi:hypothetical protein ACHAW6_007627 [Cyclotella cf. meneghiniana]